MRSSLAEDSGVQTLAEPPRIAAVARGRVLLVDAGAETREHARFLEDGTYTVEIASEDQAMARIAAGPPDLVVAHDARLVRQIRADEARRDMRVLLLSPRSDLAARLDGLRAGADDYLTQPTTGTDLLARIETALALGRLRAEADHELREEARTLETLNRVGAAVAAELDLSRAVQVVTDAATELTGAAFGAFFYNVIDQKGESYMLYTLSGVLREAFSKFPMPRNTKVFQPTFGGEGVVRSDDITKDPRYGKNAPHHGMPAGHLPVCSYLAVPVVSRSGEVLGGLFFGHPRPAVFTDRAERLAVGIASQASIAIDNARLYQAAQTELTERRRTEAALREAEERQLKLNETLEAKVAERTAELKAANERLVAEAAERERMGEALRQAQKMEAIGQLTGGVAHDFNNLLTIILGNLETIQRQLGTNPSSQGGGDRARLERSVENALRGARRAASLTQSLLAFARRQPLEPKPTDVNRLVLAMSDLLGRTLGEHIQVTTALGDALWAANADPNQLEAALLNLAVNARDAMPTGGRLTIETANVRLDRNSAPLQADLLPGNYVVVAVTDTGAGMTREVLARAFDPFFTTKDVGHATGLGLSQVYGFVKQSGGHVKIQSDVGKGTTVRLYLPRSDAAADMVEPVAAKKTPVTAHSEIILVVEDDEDVRAYTTDVLRELGYRVLQAPNGQQGLDLLMREPGVRLLFSDIGLPGGMNGRRLAEEARRRRPDLRVLFTTGYAADALVHDGRLDAGVQLITKPFTYPALAAKLREVLDGAAMTNTLASSVPPSVPPAPKPSTTPTAPAASAPGSSANVASKAGEPPCVLVVEDEALIRMVTVDTLETLGFQVAEAGSATEAVNVLQSGREIAAALIDMGLPDRKGDVLVGELRQIKPELGVIVASGYSTDNLKKRVAEDRITKLLPKPYDGRQLEAALKSIGLDAPVPTP